MVVYLFFRISILTQKWDKAEMEKKNGKNVVITFFRIWWEMRVYIIKNFMSA